ncbi:MAG: hypothetical protein A2W97_19545 [Bacteroidetes bacterium GWE2_40_63]|nr:MAG: hypothetical protein A2W84_13590 [Bacteroidetes bacterium GWC2_40_13]OFX76026.1 MAG: hypothetical protein A2W96_01075 [Bacteroidetes bacterium GWD2_40_43]OFX94360.1 MAG: hypothetical protein A2W97_19545 [Bacteroidetes bacterium GWE2_40_63]OFY18838.1 MAG: hypothetical protein A2W88_06310 [Bacteroidetes bacterium GWF2_40_13]HCC29208.1 hypothetical protein [Marinilabiliales bacterium]
MLMKSNSVLVKTLIVLGFLTGIVGLGMAFTPVKIMALFPSLVALFISLIAYFIAKAKQEKRVVVFIALLIAVAGTSVALVNEFIVKDTVVVDQKFEEKKEQSVQEVEDTDELDELQDELE